MKYLQALDMDVEMFLRQWGDTLSCSVCSTMSILLMVLFLALHGPLCSSWPNVSCGGWIVPGNQEMLSRQSRNVFQTGTLWFSFLPLQWVSHYFTWLLNTKLSSGCYCLFSGWANQNKTAGVQSVSLEGDMNSMAIYTLEGDMPAKNR